MFRGPIEASFHLFSPKKGFSFPRTMFRGPIEAASSGSRSESHILHFPRTMFRGPIEATKYSSEGTNFHELSADYVPRPH